MALDLSPENLSEEFRNLPGRPARPTYRHPDGEHFRVSHIRTEGTVITDTGRWITPTEWQQVERLE